MLEQKTNLPRLEQLRELLLILAKEIDDGPGARDMASLVKQYRETIKEIEEIEGSEPEDDEIAKLLGDSDGVPGPVRKNNAEV
jgi:hypothetical protein